MLKKFMALFGFIALIITLPSHAELTSASEIRSIAKEAQLKEMSSLKYDTKAQAIIDSSLSSIDSRIKSKIRNEPNATQVEIAYESRSEFAKNLNSYRSERMAILNHLGKTLSDNGYSVSINTKTLYNGYLFNIAW